MHFDEINTMVAELFLYLRLEAAHENYFADVKYVGNHFENN